ncbi:MAG TPA: TolC family protein [bacterium]|nr:TolC family protein [bacterium]
MRLLGLRKNAGFVPVILLPVFAAGCLTVRLPTINIQKEEEKKALTWQDMVETAREHNPDLRRARAERKSGFWSRNIAAGDYLPSVNGVLDRTRRTTPSSDEAQNQFGVNLEANQNLFSGFDTTGKTLQAQKDYGAAQWAYRETSAAVRFRLRSAYVELLKFNRLQKVNERIVDRRAQNAELIHLRYEAGRENLGSDMRAQAILDRAHFGLRQTERRIESQSLRLAREMGSDFAIPLPVEGDMDWMIPEVPAGQPDYTELALNTPQVKRLIKNAESAKAAVISAQSVIWPRVDGTYDYIQSGERPSKLEKEYVLGLRASLPLFNGGKNVQGIMKAKADYDAARQAAANSRDEAIARLSEAWTQYIDAVESVQVTKAFLEASLKRSEIIRAQYSSGLTDFQEFDIAEQELADSEIAYVESLRDALIQQANWELAIGLTLEDFVHAA